MLDTDNCGTLCMARNADYLGLSLPGVGALLVIMAVQGTCYFTLLFAVESGGGSRAGRTVAWLGRRRHRPTVASLQPRPSQVAFTPPRHQTRPSRRVWWRGGVNRKNRAVYFVEMCIELTLNK